MKNKEKYDLRNVDVRVSEDWRYDVITMSILYNMKVIGEIVVPREVTYRVMEFYNRWLEKEVQEDE